MMVISYIGIIQQIVLRWDAEIRRGEILFVIYLRGDRPSKEEV
jgi:hypothetical protein